MAISPLIKLHDSADGRLKDMEDDSRAQTAAEVAAGVIPVNYAYPPHDVRRHGAVGDGSVAASTMYDALERAWNVAIAAGHVDIYLPAGIYDVGILNFPWRQDNASPELPLLDCNYITIRGDGPQTILKTTSVEGADVLQLNSVKNLTIRDLAITAEISGTVAGSNGISITNGFDNINILDVWMLNLPSLDKTGEGDYIDGGKGLTIQTSTTSNPCGTLNARIIVIGCAEGFGYEPDLVTAAGKDTCVNVDLIAEDCHTAVKFVAVAATGALSSNMTCGLTVKAQAINCQRDVSINRLHGGSIDLQVITTKTAAARRLDPNATAWIAADTTVEALLCTYAHHGRIRVTGNKGGCDYKARIGGIGAGSSGLFSGTDDSHFDLDIGGTAVTADVLAVDSGGNTLRNSVIHTTVSTCTSLPTAFYAAAVKNRMTIGPHMTGSYTTTLTGCTTSPTATVLWSMTHDVVSLQIPGITATSNTTACTLTGMPAELFPAVAQFVLGFTTDNSVTTASWVKVETTGVLTLHVGLSSTFTNSGTKGLQSLTLTYRRS
jgi:hypothetical protein